jgi:hypothetical protein
MSLGGKIMIYFSFERGGMTNLYIWKISTLYIFHSWDLIYRKVHQIKTLFDEMKFHINNSDSTDENALALFRTTTLEEQGITTKEDTVIVLLSHRTCSRLRIMSSYEAVYLGPALFNLCVTWHQAQMRQHVMCHSIPFQQ